MVGPQDLRQPTDQGLPNRMPVLRNLESMIAGVVEGTFSRVFRSEVRPVEIARKLAREMEENQYGTLSRTYVPNEYRVYLSPRDRERFGTYEDALADELAGYLLEHARRERFALLSRPVIEFETDERLGLGEFGIETAVVTPAREEPAVQAPAVQEPAFDYYPEPLAAGAPLAEGPPLVAEPAVPLAAEPAAPGSTMVFSAAQRLAEPPVPAAPPRPQRALLIYGGRRMMVPPLGATIGRSRDCEIVVEDPSVSRR